MNVNTRNKMIQAAQEKQDGVYSIGGILYRVKNGVPTHYAENNEIFIVSGYFDSAIAKYEWRDEAKKMLRSIKD